MTRTRTRPIGQRRFATQPIVMTRQPELDVVVQDRFCASGLEQGVGLLRRRASRDAVHKIHFPDERVAWALRLNA